MSQKPKIACCPQAAWPATSGASGTGFHPIQATSVAAAKTVTAKKAGGRVRQAATAKAAGGQKVVVMTPGPIGDKV